MARADRCFTVEDFRDAARRHLPRGLFEFIDRGAEREAALDNNTAAFTRLKLKTQFLAGTDGRDTGVELFGRRIAFPAAIAPTGAAGLCWAHGEIALARAAAAAGIPFTLTSTALVSMEAIAAERGILWFQLYPWQEEADTFALIERLRDLPYEALVVTIDWGVGRTREHMDRTGFTDPISLNRRFVLDMMRHPRWVAGVLGRYCAAGGLPRHENFPERFRFRLTTPSSRKPRNSETLTWADIARIRAAWPRILIVKGILNPIDARNAVAAGADGIVVSNHGGRALDSAVATIDILPEIVAAVGSGTTVLLDSGIRFGSDIVKALALGAKAVLIGRPVLYGVAAAGQDGAARVLALLRTQFEKNMAYVGRNRPEDLGPDIFFRPAGDGISWT
jgi:isopentenyl diphosphate isomerase/L-lactate dehydrogenase-like FMN-dependent dehydrogenase